MNGLWRNCLCRNDFDLGALPFALAKRYPNAGKTQVWQRVFLQTRRWQNKETGEQHIEPSVIQRTLHEAVLRLGIPKAVDDVFRRILW